MPNTVSAPESSSQGTKSEPSAQPKPAPPALESDSDDDADDDDAGAPSLFGSFSQRQPAVDEEAIEDQPELGPARPPEVRVGILCS